MPNSNTSTERPAQLQANVAGAWKTVLTFDAGDDAAGDKIQQGALLLHEASPSTSYRITTRDRYPVVLCHLGKNTYGIWMKAQEAQQ
ncbi:MAG: hypothetical protein JZU58_28525 [Curvibacter lanceolatus]|uniref:hypothetical protein n=1 Tax=Curvibacter lanceolatus TaxID=86182 RepID=UPI0023548F3E|nr:hypothetical protein [Curvibacter lanceolatus]MBV5296304.1 hypothetical protein [Curvibacter lanceolatus]